MWLRSQVEKCGQLELSHTEFLIGFPQLRHGKGDGRGDGGVVVVRETKWRDWLGHLERGQKGAGRRKEWARLVILNLWAVARRMVIAPGLWVQCTDIVARIRVTSRSKGHF